MNILASTRVALAACALALPALAIAQTKWNLPTGYAEGNFHTQNIKQFADEVRTATGGKLDIVVHSGASLMKLTEIKRAVVGYGRAEKKQMQDMVRLLLALDAPPTPHDAADALAVAICHVHSAGGEESRQCVLGDVVVVQVEGAPGKPLRGRERMQLAEVRVADQVRPEPSVRRPDRVVDENGHAAILGP